MKSNQQIIQDSFPKHISSTSFSMLENLKEDVLRISDYGNSFVLEGEKLVLPYRVYCEPHLLAYYIGQFERLRLVAFCLLTRHHNGYVRERYLKEIITSNEKWVIPFVVQLMGEYVAEILTIIWENIDNINKGNLVSFIIENKSYWAKTKQRIVSYYEVYNSFQVRKSDYIGFKLTKRIEQLIGEENKRNHESRDIK